MDSAKKQLVDRLKSANNILVTVSRDPSIDQLAACIGLTLLLNKMNKHSVAVFSGQAPSTIEFLKPDETLEKTTDSLRDFIIALDKNKADKLRYKVENNVVRIFITPYKTSISQEDLNFSQGDFNVDVVVALGVKQQTDLDEAITAHGRILHDATVASISLSNDKSNLGTISWNNPQASSLSELVTELTTLLGDKLLDKQTATALLTGIVAETNRFSNDKTSSQTMNASSALMAAGANQQLVASKLEGPDKPPRPSAGRPESDRDKAAAGANKAAQDDPSTLSIPHDKEEHQPGPSDDKSEQKSPEPTSVPSPPQSGSKMQPGAKLISNDSPSLGGALNSTARQTGLDPVTDPLSLPQKEENQLYKRKPLAPSPQASPPPPAPTSPPAPSSPPPPSDTSDPQTLTQIEEKVHSPHTDPKKLDAARDEINEALKGTDSPTPQPIQALNAQPMGDKLHPDAAASPFDNTPEPSDADPKSGSQAGDSGKKEAPPVPPPFTPLPDSNPFDN